MLKNEKYAGDALLQKTVTTDFLTHSFVKRMTDNIEKVFREQVGKVDLTAIDARVEKLRAEMASLVKLNPTTGIDAEIYDDEYRRIAGETDKLRVSRAGVIRAEMARQEMTGRIREIAELLQRATIALWKFWNRGSTLW